MRIVRLQAENIKRITAVDITPKEDMVILSGENGAGKSSALDCIPWALTGTSGIQSDPIHEGAKKARIRLDLGDVDVVRKFHYGKKGEIITSVSVMSAEGAKFPEPQTMLDGFVGTFAFDPEEFSRMKPREQSGALAKVIDLKIDLDGIYKANREDFALRTSINRDAKTARAQAEGIAVPPATEAAPVDEAALVTELQAANDANAKARAIESDNTLAAKAHADKLAAVLRQADGELSLAAAARERSNEARRRVEIEDEACAVAVTRELELRKQAAELGTYSTALSVPPLVDVTEIRTRIDAARATNTFLADRAKLTDRRAEIERRAIELEEKSSALTAAMKARTAARDAAIAAAKLPIDDLGFGDGIVTYQGKPFDQASDAQKIRVGMAVAMAANPKLRVIRIRSGSLLDAKSKALVAAMAREHDYQVWVEQVAVPGAPMGFVIEDGRLAE